MSDGRGDVDYSQLPGLGNKDLPGFPGDVCPPELPDLTKHHSTAADVLREDPTIYHKLRERRTGLDVGLARCIKVGVDNRGHRMVKTIGMVAGDGECYDTFRELFDPVIKRHLEGTAALAGRHCDSHPTDLGRHGAGLTALRADASGKYVLSSQVRASRNLTCFRFPPAMSLDERLEVERLSAQALLELRGPLKGQYYPLRGSNSFAPRPGGMKHEEEDGLRAAGLLFEAPDSTLRLCSGSGRHWPQGRGVFTNESRTLTAWLNEQEHIRVVSVRQGDAMQLAFVDLVRALDAMADSLRGKGGMSTTQAYAHSDRLGFLTSSPTNLGTALQASIMVKVPLLAHVQAGGLQGDGSALPSWRSWCADQRVQVRSACDGSGAQLPGVFELSNMDRLGISEVGLLNRLTAVVARLVGMEQRLEANEPIAEMLATHAQHPEAPADAAAEAANKACCTLLFGLEHGRMLDALCDVGSYVGDRASASVDNSGAHFVFDSLFRSVVKDPTVYSKTDAQAKQEAELIENTVGHASRPVSVASISTMRCSSASTVVNNIAAGDIVSGLVSNSVNSVVSPEPDDRARRRSPNMEKVPEAPDETFEAFCLKGVVPKGPPYDGDEFRPGKGDEAPAPALDVLRGRLHTRLFDALDSGQLEEVMQETLGKGERAAAPRGKSAAFRVLAQVSDRDRRIGELTALARDAERRIAEGGENCSRYREMISYMKQDIAHLELDIEWHRRALQGAEERGLELEAGQRRLFLELDSHTQKFKHSESEVTARSELSTTSGGGTMATMTEASCASGFSPHRGQLEPLDTGRKR